MFHRPHIYTVHIKASARGVEEMPIFVREGFNFWAFLLTVLWALYHRLWLVAGGILFFNIGVAAIKNAGWITEPSSFVLLLAMQVLVGFEANDWLRAKLARQGNITAGIVTGDSLIRAEQRFFDQQLRA